MSRAELLVREPGLRTLVIDAGRLGWQHLGMPPAGAADAETWVLANALAAASPGSAALEVTHAGPTLEVTEGTVFAGIAGACEVTLRDGADSRTLAGWCRLIARPGAVLELGRVRDGLRAYLAVAGGIDVPPFLGSRSANLRGGAPGLLGRALLAGDRLPIGPSPRQAWVVPGADPPPWRGETGAVRVVPGPQAEALTERGSDTFLAADWVVASASDRGGLRLEGPIVELASAADIASEGCAAGSVQITGGGRPIVLLVDRGTTGGYVKPFTIASVDLPRLGRLRPGESLRFSAVSVEEALALRRAREIDCQAWAAAIR